MSAVALLLVLAQASGAAPRLEGLDGPILLLGEDREVSHGVPLFGDSVLLVAAAPSSPAPLDTRTWGAPPDTWILDVHAAQPTRDELARLRSCGLLLLGPGNAAQWDAVLHAGPKPSALTQALLEAWHAGAVLVARGDGAVVLASTYFVQPDAQSSPTQRNPREDPGLRLARGLGILPFGLVDTEARSGGRLERLMARLEDGTCDLGLYLPAKGGVVLQSGLERVDGDGIAPALVLDARTARRTGRSFDGIELTALTPGKRWTPQASRGDPTAQAAQQVQVEDPWTAQRWLQQLVQPDQPWSLAGEHARLTYRPLRGPGPAPPDDGITPPPAPRGELTLQRL